MSRPRCRARAWCLMVGAVIGLAGCACAAERSADEAALPKAASEALAQAFPRAEVEEVRMEDLFGLTLFEVRLRNGSVRLSLAVFGDGTIAEVRSPETAQGLPRPVVAEVAEAAVGAEIRKVTRIDAQAEARLTRLEKPRTTYQVIVVRGDRRGRLRVSADGAVLDALAWKDGAGPDDDEPGAEGDERLLPKRAAEAIRAAFPRVTIQEVVLSEECGLRIYDAETIGGSGERQVKVTEEGVIVETDVETPAAHLPKVVSDAARRVAQGADIGMARRQEIRVAARWVRLDPPRVRFEITVAQGGREGRIAVRPDGVALGSVRWK